MALDAETRGGAARPEDGARRKPNLARLWEHSGPPSLEKGASARLTTHSDGPCSKDLQKFLHMWRGPRDPLLLIYEEQTFSGNAEGPAPGLARPCGQ